VTKNDGGKIPLRVNGVESGDEGRLEKEVWQTDLYYYFAAGLSGPRFLFHARPLISKVPAMCRSIGRIGCCVVLW
jgi:hypothetical protein